MPIEFYDIPQDTPSVLPVEPGTGYCSASDVASLNKSRAAAWGLSNMPTLQDVNGYIVMVAGQIDAVLLAKGYRVPVNTASYPEVEGLLAYVNAQGAAYMVEEASPSSPNIDRVKAAYDAALMSLEAAQFALDVPVDTDRARVRAPFVTYQPDEGTFDPMLDDSAWGCDGDGISQTASNRRQLPFFSRSMRF